MRRKITNDSFKQALWPEAHNNEREQDRKFDAERITQTTGQIADYGYIEVNNRGYERLFGQKDNATIREISLILQSDINLMKTDSTALIK